MPRPRATREPPPALAAEAPVGLAALDTAGEIRWANRAFVQIAGPPPRPPTRSARASRPRAAAAPGVWDTIREVMRSGSGSPVRGVQIPGAGSGPPSFVDVALRPLPDRAGGTDGWIVALTDVSERLEEHARAGLFYYAFLTSSNPMEVTDRNGVLVDVNPAFERVYGYTRAECLGHKPSLVASSRTTTSEYARMWRDLLDPGRGHWSGEIVNQDRSGKEHPVFLTITAVRNEGGEATHYIGVAVDLTEQRAWARQAAHADKLASLGQLAAGVAHEINTPLANVMLVTESVRRRSHDPWVLSRLDTIAQQVEVAATIVRGLLDFARRSEPQFSTLDLAAVIRDAIGFLRGKQSVDVDIELHLPEAPTTISGDRGQIIQALTNILNNAYEAMEGRGRIQVQLRRTGIAAEVEITDSGPGIPEHVLPHIFEPFFTTKPEGQGTGLGLAICHGVMQAHHGSIVARNVPDGGASFVLSFPLVATAPPAP